MMRQVCRKALPGAGNTTGLLRGEGGGPAGGHFQVCGRQSCAAVVPDRACRPGLGRLGVPRQVCLRALSGGDSYWDTHASWAAQGAGVFLGVHLPGEPSRAWPGEGGGSWVSFGFILILPWFDFCFLLLLFPAMGQVLKVFVAACSRLRLAAGCLISVCKGKKAPRSLLF